MVDNTSRWVASEIRARARALRRPMTPPEQKLWFRLRRNQIEGFKFKRQHPIGRFIVDFYCGSCRLVIELDGDTHVEQQEYDAARTAWLEQQGCRVIRFCNRDVCNNTDGVLEVILRACRGEKIAEDELGYAVGPAVPEGDVQDKGVA